MIEHKDGKPKTLSRQPEHQQCVDLPAHLCFRIPISTKPAQEDRQKGQDDIEGDFDREAPGNRKTLIQRAEPIGLQNPEIDPPLLRPHSGKSRPDRKQHKSSPVPRQDPQHATLGKRPDRRRRLTMKAGHRIGAKKQKRREHEKDADAEPTLRSRHPIPGLMIDTGRSADMNDQDANDSDRAHRIQMAKMAIPRRPRKI
jgi:hypothetical protein